MVDHQGFFKNLVEDYVPSLQMEQNNSLRLITHSQKSASKLVVTIDDFLASSDARNSLPQREDFIIHHLEVIKSYLRHSNELEKAPLLTPQSF